MLTFCNCCPKLTNFDEKNLEFQQIERVKLSPYKEVKSIQFFAIFMFFRRETFSFSSLIDLIFDLIFLWGYLPNFAAQQYLAAEDVEKVIRGEAETHHPDPSKQRRPKLPNSGR